MNDRVLVVDDSLTVRMDLAEAFAAAGFVPVVCATAGEARDAIADGPIAIAILDVILPDGDGVNLLGELRASPAGAEAVVLMLSSEAEVKDRIRGLRTGADEYVGKPYDIGYVVGRARELRRAHRPHVGATTILVIDDSITFRDGLREVLAGAGYEVVAAASGEDGLRVAAEVRPHAIVVDGVLPGIDGSTVIRTVRLDAAMRDVPCVLLTGAEDRGAELRALDAGADAFVRKDEDLSVVLAKLRAVLRRTHGSQHDFAVSALGPKKILAVDDSPTFLDAVATSLRGDGYDVILARTGEEALELIAVQAVDCILLDLMMPGIGGHETCRRIKAVPGVRDIPLVMLTGREDRDAMIEGLTAGADDYIPKSSEPAVINARVRAQIRRKQLEDEGRRIREELLCKEIEAAEARAAREVAETRAALVEELDRKNKELEAFSYSVSHDLRAPLRSVDGFSKALLDDYADRLDERGRDYLVRVRRAATRMGELIDDMLLLSRVSRGELVRGRYDLVEVARDIVGELARKEPARAVRFDSPERLFVDGDLRLVRILLENLLGNAWKFTARTPDARIELGMLPGGVCFVRDNGAGFDMARAHRLFAPFQRLHGEAEFPGTGIGLATVHRIVDRHGGRVWAEGAIGRGASLFFTLARENGN